MESRLNSGAGRPIGSSSVMSSGVLRHKDPNVLQPAHPTKQVRNKSAVTEPTRHHEETASQATPTES